ncbi:putative transferase [Escherichia coli]|uniref:Putative transferase n=1 Tax=Escherichia coli TaxID=562 RepID=A0A377CUK8_ECOLX|nr:putative transferase [Escherichia coli]
MCVKTSCFDWRKCRGTWRTDLLDEHVVIQGESRITGAVIIENHVELTDHAVVEAFDGDTVHVRGPKVINGEERITRTPLAGLL